MATPSSEEVRRSYAKSWLLDFATPESLLDMLDSLLNAHDDGQFGNDGKMIKAVYRQLTGVELD